MKLIQEQVFLFMPSVENEVGVDGAIILQKIQSLILETGPNNFVSSALIKWVRIDNRMLFRTFNFWSKRHINSIIKRLSMQNVLIVENSDDECKWYSIQTNKTKIMKEEKDELNG